MTTVSSIEKVSVDFFFLSFLFRTHHSNHAASDRSTLPVLHGFNDIVSFRVGNTHVPRRADLTVEAASAVRLIPLSLSDHRATASSSVQVLGGELHGRVRMRDGQWAILGAPDASESSSFISTLLGESLDLDALLTMLHEVTSISLFFVVFCHSLWMHDIARTQ